MNYQEAIKGYTGVIQAYALAHRTAEKLSTDAWAVLVREVQSALKNGKTRDQIMEEMKVAEDTWKASTGDSVMPSTYRSAKAVCLKAVAAGLSLVDADGNPNGKTAMEKAYKEKAALEEGDAVPTEEEHDAEIMKLVSKLGALWPKLDSAKRDLLVAQIGIITGVVA
jgi:hypothetical protein